MFKFKKSIFRNSRWIFLIFSLLIFPCVSFRCVNDDLIENKRHISARSINYRFDKRHRRVQDESSFQPLRIHFYLDSLFHSMPPNAIHNINLALQKVGEYIGNTFQVRDRGTPFLLKRENCIKEWQYGVNKNKCSQASNTVELCLAKEINHAIPGRFLARLDVYEFSKDKPVFSYPGGPGLLSSNFIAFVTSQITSVCDGKDVSAYGTACRFNPVTNEPLAGILNICPNYFSLRVYPYEHYYNVLLHEMFHILGFSGPFFEKYLPCEEGKKNCGLPKNVIQNDETGIPRLLFPLVIENAQKHFKCFKQHYGGPMSIKGLSDNATYDSASLYSSHWHPLLMFSSIMTPSFSEFEKLYVDNITLAVFASTGWYQMNFTSEETFEFGRGQGCYFGLNGTCAQSPYLCDPSQGAIGCDLNHRTIGRCVSVVDTHSCGVFQPYSIRDCATEVEGNFGLDFSTLGYSQKCFMQQTDQSQPLPACLPMRCRSESTYDIFVNMSWYQCDSSNEIIKGNISCPDGVIFCRNTRPTEDRVFCKSEDFFIAVRIYFSHPKFGYLRSREHSEEFKVTTLQKIAKSINLPVNYIVNSTLNAFKQVYLDFLICPPSNLLRERLNGIINRTQKFLDSGSLVHVLMEPDEAVIVSSNDMKIHPSVAIEFSDHEGFRALLVFPVLCGIFIIVTFVASLLRRFLIKKHNPKSFLELSPSNIQSQQDSV